MSIISVNQGPLTYDIDNVTGEAGNFRATENYSPDAPLAESLALGGLGVKEQTGPEISSPVVPDVNA